MQPGHLPSSFFGHATQHSPQAVIVEKSVIIIPPDGIRISEENPMDHVMGTGKAGKNGSDHIQQFAAQLHQIIPDAFPAAPAAVRPFFA
jgi:hypothetical protein